MRLLSTDRAELHFFASPGDIPGGYAILSHVWDEHEDTFQDAEGLRAKCAESEASPRDLVSDKIRQSCVLAEKHGYRWIWVDTCCIDKSSSAELSEAINSMYRYYALSTICYAFLRDVSTRGDVTVSIWYERGWTLQELLAPKFLVFVSNQWEVLGTKGDLASEISDRTRIPEDVLRHEEDLAYVPVGQRMAWASLREMTRVEDRAYSLMGIFGINMPTLYGEGHNAFYRLQEEIMKTCIDPTLFAWGGYQVTDSSLHDYSAGKPVLYENPKDAQHDVSCKHLLSGQRALLASSPSEFGGGEMHLLDVCGADETLKEFASIMDFDVPSFETTPHGVLAYLPVVKHPTTSHAFIALLSYAKYHGGRLLGLHLFQCFHASAAQRKLPVFHVGEQFAGRLLFFKGLGKRSKPRWTKFYLPGKPPFRSTLDTLPRSLTRIQLVSSSPYRISGGTVDAFSDITGNKGISIDKVSNTAVGWAGSTPLAIQFRYNWAYSGAIYFLITLGCCQHSRTPDSSLNWGPQWATFRYGCFFNMHNRSSAVPDWKWAKPPEDSHQCGLDHIDRWPRAEDGRWLRSYSVPWHATKRLVVSFSTCPLNTKSTTLVLKMGWMSENENKQLRLSSIDETGSI